MCYFKVYLQGRVAEENLTHYNCNSPSVALILWLGSAIEEVWQSLLNVSIDVF